MYFSVVIRLRFGWLRDQAPVSRRVKTLLCSERTDRFWDPSSLHVNGFRGPNRPRCEAYLPASASHVMNARSFPHALWHGAYCSAGTESFNL